jgi:hypothetical protein
VLLAHDKHFHAPSWSSASELAELSVSLDLSIDFDGPAFSLSVVVAIGGGMAPTSASDAEETMQAACEARRAWADQCDCITWTVWPLSKYRRVD